MLSDSELRLTPKDQYDKNHSQHQLIPLAKISKRVPHSNNVLINVNNQPYEINMNSISEAITGADIVNKNLNPKEAQDDLTGWQMKNNQYAIKNPNISRRIDDMKDIAHVTGIPIKMASNAVNKIPSKTLSPKAQELKQANKIGRGIDSYVHKHKHILQYLINSPHYLNEQIKSRQLVKGNDFLGNAIDSDAKFQQSTQTKGEFINNICKQKSQEIKHNYDARYITHDIKISLSEDPYLRLVIDAVQNHSKGNRYKLRNIASKVVMRQYDSNYNPIKQHHYDVVHKTDQNPLDKRTLQHAKIQLAKVKSNPKIKQIKDIKLSNNKWTSTAMKNDINNKRNSRQIYPKAKRATPIEKISSHKIINKFSGIKPKYKSISDYHGAKAILKYTLNKRNISR